MKSFSEATIFFFISPFASIDIFTVLSKLFSIDIPLDVPVSFVTCPNVNCCGVRSKPGLSPSLNFAGITCFFKGALATKAISVMIIMTAVIRMILFLFSILFST